LVCSSRVIGKGDPNYTTRVAGAESLMTIDVVGYFNGANESGNSTCRMDMKVINVFAFYRIQQIIHYRLLIIEFHLKLVHATAIES
jgi:hypothetical protein